MSPPPASDAEAVTGGSASAPAAGANVSRDERVEVIPLPTRQREGKALAVEVTASDVTLTAPFDCGCTTEANLISRFSPPLISLNLSESNCLSLSVMNSFGTPKQQTMFFHTNFYAVAKVIAPSGSASIQREKYSMAKIANLYPFRATGNGPMISSTHLAKGQIGAIGWSSYWGVVWLRPCR